tara:strand:- start:624 stop:1244 length:621 start_codon:yes stop_codon:yes gene_type:complete
MNKIAIFGKKESIAKYDLTENKPVWVGELPKGQTPHVIAQYENYILVFSWAWFGSKMVHCFREDSGEFLWSHYQQTLHSSLIPFLPHTFENHMYYLASSKEVAKLSWETGDIVFRKRFKKSIFNEYGLGIISNDVILLSKKDALIVNKETGDVKPYPELSKKLNLKEITAALGNGISFMSLISLTHPQEGDGGAGATAAGGGDGGS